MYRLVGTNSCTVLPRLPTVATRAQALAVVAAMHAQAWLMAVVCFQYTLTFVQVHCCRNHTVAVVYVYTLALVSKN
jgi:hypothetical protein